MPTALVLRATSLRPAHLLSVRTASRLSLQPPWRQTRQYGSQESGQNRAQDKAQVNAQGPSRTQSRHRGRKPRQRTPASPFIHRSRTHITWARVHELGRKPLSNRFAKHQDAVLEPRPAVRRLRGMHLQWGYIRHQCPKEELVASRRLFSSWKIKFHNVVAARNLLPYSWCDKGRWLFELDSVPEMRRAWEEVDAQRRRKEWPLTMLSTLHACPEKAEMVLEATLDPLPPGYAIVDVLTFIARRLRLDSIRDFRRRTLKAEEIVDLVVKTLRDLPAGHVPFGQRAFGLLARKLPADQAGELYAELQRSKHALHPNTALHFASTLASDASRKPMALEILRGLAERGVDLNGPVPQSAITSLLHYRIDKTGGQESWGFSPREALEQLMEKGFSPNHINATAFLDTLCRQCEVEEAIRLALLFAESGVQLDKRSWSTVFRGAKHSLNIDNIVKSFDVAKAAHAPYMDVLNNALHAIYYFADMESRESGARAPWIVPVFEPMLRLYAQRFELEPLQGWLPDSLPLILTQPDGFEDKLSRPRYPWKFLHGLTPAIQAFFSALEGPRIRPSTTTVSLLVRAYMRSLRQPYDLVAYYNFFKSRLEEESRHEGSFGLQLMRDQGSLIHDTLIMTMTERRGLSRPALQVFGDMLTEHLQQGTASRVHPPPSLCTFSILIRGLMAKGHHDLAQRVLRVMRQQGLQPDLVTWNTLVKGHATVQSVGRTVQALQDMESAGYRPDAFTFKAFGKLRDQARALEMMEGIIEENRLRMSF